MVSLKEVAFQHGYGNRECPKFITSSSINQISYYLGCVLAGAVPFMYSNRFGISWPKVQPFFEAVRCNEGKDLPMGAAGFCWGGKHTVNLAHGGLATNGKPFIDAGFTGHPSALNIPGELKDVVKPLSLALAEKDMSLSLAQVEQIRKALKESSAEHEVIVYEGAGHGFCVRADLNNEKVMEQSIAAEEQAVNWFKEVFGKTEYSGK
jgi:dienelactone hydrolase